MFPAITYLCPYRILSMPLQGWEHSSWCVPHWRIFMVRLKLRISSSRGYQCIMQTLKTYYASVSGKAHLTNLSLFSCQCSGIGTQNYEMWPFLFSTKIISMLSLLGQGMKAKGLAFSMMSFSGKQTMCWGWAFEMPVPALEISAAGRRAGYQGFLSLAQGKQQRKGFDFIHWLIVSLTNIYWVLQCAQAT